MAGTRSPPPRPDVVERARHRLRAGVLDHPDVYRAVAESILRRR